MGRGTAPDFEHFLRRDAWLAGFIDGEGHFAVYLDSAKGNAWPVLEITQRDDDLVLMEEIANALGGSLKRKLGHTLEGGYEQNAQCRVSVVAKASLLGVVAYLDEHSPKTKKYAEYMIWRTAVLEYVESGGKCKSLLDTKDELQRLKQYRPPLAAVA